MSNSYIGRASTPKAIMTVGLRQLMQFKFLNFFRSNADTYSNAEFITLFYPKFFNPSRPYPGRRKKIKSKAFIKPFEATQRSVKIKL